MSEPRDEEQLSELIVEFHRGVSEDEARAVVLNVGGSIRRRMRSDSPAEVTLLVRVPEGELSEIEAKLSRSRDVARTEKNVGGFFIAGK